MTRHRIDVDEMTMAAVKDECKLTRRPPKYMVGCMIKIARAAMFDGKSVCPTCKEKLQKNVGLKWGERE